jgi:beta-galactosidase
VLVVAALYTAADDDLDFLTAYAQAGGHLVVGPRTGYGDVEGRARAERAPGRLSRAAGAWYAEIGKLPQPVPVTGLLAGAGTGFAEGLVVDGAQTVATYVHPHFGRWAAVTTVAAGSGRITVVGTVPDAELAAALVRWLVATPVGGWMTDDSVTVSTSSGASGQRLHVVHNWSWDPAAATPGTPVTDLLTGETLQPGDRIPLGSWGVRIFRSDTG